jgi:hypothetical protein
MIHGHLPASTAHRTLICYPSSATWDGRTVQSLADPSFGAALQELAPAAGLVADGDVTAGTPQQRVSQPGRKRCPAGHGRASQALRPRSCHRRGPVQSHARAFRADRQRAPPRTAPRALSDTLGAALLLAALIDALPDGGTLTITELNRIAGYPGDANHKDLTQAQPEQISLPGI